MRFSFSLLKFAAASFVFWAAFSTIGFALVEKASPKDDAVVLDPSCPDAKSFDDFEGLPVDEVFAEGDDCLIAGHPNSALLRFEYAWGQDHADSATKIGEMYDPDKWDPARSPFSKPSRIIADMWYERAEKIRRLQKVQ